MAIPEGRVCPCLQQQAHSLVLPCPRCHVKQGAAVLIHGLVEQGAGHSQGLCALPILAASQHVLALRHSQEMPQRPHVPRFAGSEQGIEELGLRVSCEERTGRESGGFLGRAVLCSD